MPVDRPTFSESWHRVAHLRPRLRATVQTYRQHFRGEPWHVVQDRASNQHFRVTDAAYHLLGLLDGRRSVAEAWELTNERFGDAAPTQGEVIQLLGQLYTSNLLQAELPPDAEGLFERQRKRIRREVGGYMMNFLFIRIPLVDPDRFLSRWLGVFSWWFSPVGIALWLVLIAAGVWHLLGRGQELMSGAMGILEVENLLLLYLCFAGTKLLHELGHGFACKRFGRGAGGGEVHTIGIMFLVFMPVPYVDASSSWAFRNRWHRAYVGAAGMYVELAIAAVAAMVWASTASHTLVNAIAYNVLFIASVSTILFNGNPLLRFDGYYILSDVLEIPNLSKRARDQFYYLVKRYIYGVRRATSPARSGRERVWLLVYHVAAIAYRIFICIVILLFIASFFLVVAILLCVAVLVTWLGVPLGKWVKYLATSPELSRVRRRAVTSSVGTVGAIIVLVMGLPLPDRGRAEAVVEPVRFVQVHAGEAGFIEDIAADGLHVRPGEVLVRSVNPQLESELAELRAEHRELQVRYDKAEGEDRAAARMYMEQLDVIAHRIERLEQRLAALKRTSGIEGLWVSEDHQRLADAWVERGQMLGMVAGGDDLIVRAIADQRLGPRVGSELGVGSEVEMRVRGRPQDALRGTIRRVLPAGQVELPSAALGYFGGGRLPVRGEDPEGRAAIEPIFELHIEPHLRGDSLRLRSGQRVVVRFTFQPRPLGAQLWRSARQLVQERFQM